MSHLSRARCDTSSAWKEEHSFPAETLADPSALWCSCWCAHAVPTARPAASEHCFHTGCSCITSQPFRVFSFNSQTEMLLLGTETFEAAFSLHPAATNYIQVLAQKLSVIAFFKCRGNDWPLTFLNASSGAKAHFKIGLMVNFIC